MVHYNISPNDHHKKHRHELVNVKTKPKRGFLATKFVEFCKRTDLHGYKYIVADDLHVFERCCWGVAVALSIVLAIYLVLTAYNWYARNPIVTGHQALDLCYQWPLKLFEIFAVMVIESTQGAIWDIPFPAVTICNLNIISKRAARTFSDNMTLPANVTADEVFETIRISPMLHSTYALDPGQKRALLTLQSVMDLNNVSVEDLFRQLSPASSCNDLVQRCMWKNTIYKCDLLFQQIFTYFSVCCSFNYFAVESTNHNKMPVEFLQPLSPRRVASCGYQTGLTVLVNTSPDDYYSSSVASQGAVIFIDNAYNLADVDSPMRLINPKTEVMIAVSPERTYSTSGIKGFNPDIRQCYYSDEVQIGVLQQYSFHNCMAFQRTEAIRKTCDCVPYFFPMKGSYRTCNFKDLDCLEDLLGAAVDGRGFNADDEEIAFQCLPECEHYDYPIEIAIGKLSNNVRLVGLPFFNEISLINCSVVNVFFNDLVSTRYRRDVYLNWQNLLASFGGLLSLMLGFTLISGFDLILFFTYGFAYSTFKGRQENRSTQRTSQNVNVIHVQDFYKYSSDKVIKKGLY